MPYAKKPLQISIFELASYLKSQLNEGSVMSLTTWLKKNPYFYEKVLENTGELIYGKNRKLLCPPLSKNYAHMGVCADYLMKFELQYQNQGIAVVPTLFAESVFKTCEFNRFVKLDLVVAKRLIDRTKQMKSEFLKTGVLTRDFAKAIIEMSYLDHVGRSGNGYDDVGIEACEEDIQDMLNLHDVMRRFDLSCKHHCIIAPYFAFPNGAEGDFIVDGCLGEMKTSKKLFHDPYQIAQAVSYYLLSEISPIGTTKQIDRIAFYNSRYGCWSYLPVDKIKNKNYLSEILENQIQTLPIKFDKKDSRLDPQICDQPPNIIDSLDRQITEEAKNHKSIISDGLWIGGINCQCYIDQVLDEEEIKIASLLNNKFNFTEYDAILGACVLSPEAIDKFKASDDTRNVIYLKNFLNQIKSQKFSMFGFCPLDEFISLQGSSKTFEFYNYIGSEDIY